MNTKTATAANLTKSGYEACVKARAIARAGGCNNINGHILEIMGADSTNLNPFNMFHGVKETLSSSPTAQVADSFITKCGNVVEQIQYKDCSHSIGDVIRRVKSGQYNGATLKGTTETAKVFNAYAAKHGMTARMKDVGVSQNTTKSLGYACGGCRQVSYLDAVTWSAKSGGVWGGAITGGMSAVTNIAAVCNGEKTGWDAARCIAKDTAGGALAGAIAAAAATTIGKALSGNDAPRIATVAIPVAAAVGIGWGVSKMWNSIFA